MSSIRFEITRDPEEFATRAQAFLGARIERNVLATVLLNVLSGRFAGGLARERLFVWDDHGPASMVSLSPIVAGVTRLGPVYTPPELRRRGYASSAVAAASRRALAEGGRRCALFTDLSNPTSNKIYDDVGYRRIAD